MTREMKRTVTKAVTSQYLDKLMMELETVSATPQDFGVIEKSRQKTHRAP